MRHIFLATAIILAQNASPLQATTPNCEAYAAQAAQRHGLPNGLLRAIARTESGRAQGKAGLRAWPWTSNVRGKGYYYNSKEDALAHLVPLVKQGVTSFDVGCMQLNFRWHGDNFATLSDMIDPARNTEYAARYLLDLRAETGGWDGATRYYHSRTPERGNAYLGRVRKMLAGLSTVESQAVPVTSKVAARTESAKPKKMQHGPLVSFSAPAAYWMSPVLDAGKQPVLP